MLVSLLKVVTRICKRHCGVRNAVSESVRSISGTSKIAIYLGRHSEYDMQMQVGYD